MDLSFYKGKKVLVTGHTGFKGTWLCRILINAGAQVTGYSLNPPTEPNLFSMADVESRMNSVIGDIRDLDHLKKVFEQTQPEIVLHLAAQPIVRDSYKDPVYTYETNVMGTVNICECVRLNPCVKSFLNVTTDKVYKNNEWEWGYRENEPLDGFDPYSNSKSCSELVTHSYINSFFNNMDLAVSTARAGNVIGGGDFANDRIVPDCVRAAIEGKDIIVRNPHSTRPYQHVLEPLAAYLIIAQKQFEDKKYAGFYNEQQTISSLQSNILSSFVPRNPDGSVVQYTNQLTSNSPLGSGHAGFLTANEARNSRENKYWIVANQLDYKVFDDLVLTASYAYKNRNYIYKRRSFTRRGSNFNIYFWYYNRLLSGRAHADRRQQPEYIWYLYSCMGQKA